MKEILHSIGFDEKESKIYLALLKAGQSSVSGLLKHTQIERRTIYDVLERLVQKGHASYFEENKTKIFIPTKPEVILTELEQKKAMFEKIIPKLSQLEKNPKEVKVEILKGIKGLTTIFHEIVEKNQNHISFGDLSPLIYKKKYNRLIKQFLSTIEKKGLKEKIIYTKGDNIEKIKNGQYRFVEKEMVFPTPTLIYGNTIIQYVYTDPITIIKITSKEIANTHKKYFNYFWKLAKKK